MSRDNNFIVRVAWVTPDASGFFVNVEPANATQAHSFPGEQRPGDQLEQDSEQPFAVLIADVRLGGKRFLKLGAPNDRSFSSHVGNVPPQTVE